MTKYIGIEKVYKGKAIVCFLDLLGFSQHIKDNWDSVDKNPLTEILEMKNILKGDDFSHGVMLQMNDNEGSKNTIYCCNVKTISDSLIVTIPINENLTIADVVFSMSSLIHNIAKFWGLSLSTGYTIRGGIDFGDIYWDENEIIGPAFINAYEIESKIAKSSRVVCSEKFIKFLLDLIGQAESLCQHELLKFSIDDGLLCLNPNVIYETEKDRLELIDIIRELRKNQSDKIKSKYIDLEMKMNNPNEIEIPKVQDLVNLILK